MSPETTSTRICPTCGSKVSEGATRCQVCGRPLTPVVKAKSSSPVQAPRLPEVTLNLPIAIGLLILILFVGAGATFLALSGTHQIAQPTPSATPTLTATVTLTPTLAPTATPQPTFTPLPPISYTIQSGDLCSGLAYFYNVTVQSIIDLNHLTTSCVLIPGQTLLIPQPTPTASPTVTSTLNASSATQSACQTDTYTVQANDTLGGIANAYAVSINAIESYNGLPSDVVWQGMVLIIPLCERAPTAGPTPTPTNPPPYPAANLLLPDDGAAFNASNDTVSLQWSSVGTLRTNEFYEVHVEDVTAGADRKLVDYVTDTRYNVPITFRPGEGSPHIIRWWVVPVRQTGTDSDGKAIYSSAGAASTTRVFSWTGLAGATTPTP
ncbi:MAG TPA: LysM peptidoglycan-binding domain-containing protein [Longilinea sp.]|nr:LysM peptidoglycan-binding domain-containing protein [Longilinea sp.]